MCTINPGGKELTFFENIILKLEDQNNTEKASEIYFINGHRYKSDDYYCLKPESNKDPNK